MSKKDKLVKFQKEKIKSNSYSRPIKAEDFVLIYDDGHGQVELLSIELNPLMFKSRASASSWVSWFKEDAFINLRAIQMQELMPNYFKNSLPQSEVQRQD